MRNFKFLKPQLLIHQMFGEDLGYVANLEQLDRVMEITVHIIRFNILPTHEFDKATLMIPLMFRLYRDKEQIYTYKHIANKVREIDMHMEHAETKRAIADIVTEAFMTVDVEAELVQYLYNKLNWYEGF